MSDAPKRRKSLAWWVRWAHVYVSMIGFLALLGFAVTGLTLNHASYFEGPPGDPVEVEGTLDRAWLPEADDGVDKLAIAESLRAEHGLRGAVTEFLVDPEELLIVFKGPGYSADVFVDREAASYTLIEQARGWMAILDDLHKGRDSGEAWSWVVDVSAVLMTLTSLTGIWLLLYLKKRRGPSLWAGLAGAVTLVVIYWLAVP